ETDTIKLLSCLRPPTDEERAEIARLIEQFKDDDYSHREAAFKRLAELGGAAETQLHEQLNSDLPETRVRCRLLLRQLHSVELTPKLASGDSQFNDVEISPDGKTIA